MHTPVESRNKWPNRALHHRMLCFVRTQINMYVPLVVMLWMCRYNRRLDDSTAQVEGAPVEATAEVIRGVGFCSVFPSAPSPLLCIRLHQDLVHIAHKCTSSCPGRKYANAAALALLLIFMHRVLLCCVVQLIVAALHCRCSRTETTLLLKRLQGQRNLAAPSSLCQWQQTTRGQPLSRALPAREWRRRCGV